MATPEEMAALSLLRGSRVDPRALSVPRSFGAERDEDTMRNLLLQLRLAEMEGEQEGADRFGAEQVGEELLQAGLAQAAEREQQQAMLQQIGLDQAAEEQRSLDAVAADLQTAGDYNIAMQAGLLGLPDLDKQIITADAMPAEVPNVELTGSFMSDDPSALQVQPRNVGLNPDDPRFGMVRTIPDLAPDEIVDSINLAESVTVPDERIEGLNRKNKASVKAAQEALIEQGFLAPTYRTRSGKEISSADGDFGRMTSAALKAYEESKQRTAPGTTPAPQFPDAFYLQEESTPAVDIPADVRSGATPLIDVEQPMVVDEAAPNFVFPEDRGEGFDIKLDEVASREAARQGAVAAAAPMTTAQAAAANTAATSTSPAVVNRAVERASAGGAPAQAALAQQAVSALMGAQGQLAPGERRSVSLDQRVRGGTVGDVQLPNIPLPRGRNIPQQSTIALPQIGSAPKFDTGMDPEAVRLQEVANQLLLDARAPAQPRSLWDLYSGDHHKRKQQQRSTYINQARELFKRAGVVNRAKLEAEKQRQINSRAELRARMDRGRALLASNDRRLRMSVDYQKFLDDKAFDKAVQEGRFRLDLAKLNQLDISNRIRYAVGMRNASAREKANALRGSGTGLSDILAYMRILDNRRRYFGAELGRLDKSLTGVTALMAPIAEGGQEVLVEAGQQRENLRQALVQTGLEVEQVNEILKNFLSGEPQQQETNAPATGVPAPQSQGQKKRRRIKVTP
tara:strand:+ start:4671 stop:6887 length:2217 start_codon:yes stop_codon:yes gene_type:complete